MPGAKRPSYTIHDGFRIPMGFPVDAFASGCAYRAHPGDIIVTTYPKCGTTWVQHIVYLLLHGGEPLPAGVRMTTAIPHLEEVGAAFVEALPEPRCIKTHLPYAMTPQHSEAKYVYVARNPFDCAVSFFHHTRGFVKHYDFADGTFDDYFECFLAGEVDFGDYFDNLLSWHAHADDENLLFVTYEDLKADPKAGIVAIARFLGGAAAIAATDPTTLAAVVHHSSFDAMKKDQERWASRRPDGMPAFIRKGVVGDWRSHFSPDQARRLAAKFDERTRGTSLASLWTEILEEARTGGRAS